MEYELIEIDDEELVKETNRDIVYIEKELQELQYLFEDFGELVVKQKVLLNEIGTNIENSNLEIEDANNDLLISLDKLSEKFQGPQKIIRSVIGAATGGTILGTAGLIISSFNPIIGLTAVALGASGGGAIGYSIKK